MTKYQEYLSEATKQTYEVYHDSLTAAVQEMENYVLAKGFDLDAEQMAEVVGFGPAKPSKGKTNRYSLFLFKNNKKQRKAVNFQVYNRGTDRNTFELNVYIS